MISDVILRQTNILLLQSGKQRDKDSFQQIDLYVSIDLL